MNSIIGHLAIIRCGPALPLAGAILRYWRDRRMVAALRALDDATLKDIGVFRCDIPSKVRERCLTVGWM